MGKSERPHGPQDLQFEFTISDNHQLSFRQLAQHDSERTKENLHAFLRSQPPHKQNVFAFERLPRRPVQPQIHSVWNHRHLRDLEVSRLQLHFNGLAVYYHSIGADQTDVLYVLGGRLVLWEVHVVKEGLVADPGRFYSGKYRHRSEERRVGKEGRSRWSPY